MFCIPLAASSTLYLSTQYNGTEHHHVRLLFLPLARANQLGCCCYSKAMTTTLLMVLMMMTTMKKNKFH